MGKFSINGGGNGNMTLQDRTIDGFEITVACTTIADLTTAVLETFTIQTNLYRAGSNNLSPISGNLFALGIADNPGSWEANAIGNQKSFFVSLGSVLALQGADRLQVTVTAPSGITGLNTTVSDRVANGVEAYTPYVQMFPLNKNQTNQNIPCGDNVNCIAVVNTSTDFVATQINGRSEMWECEVAETEMYAKLAQQWTRTPNPYVFHLYTGCEMDDVSLSCTIDSGSTGNGYIVVYSGVRSQKVSQRAAERMAKIARKQRTKYAPR